MGSLMSRDYRKRADELLPKLELLYKWGAQRRDKHPDLGRAFVLEFAGMPKSGKSTTIAEIRHFFSHGPKILHNNGVPWAKKDGFRIFTPAEGVSLRTPSFLKGNLAHFNTWAGAYALQLLLEAQYDQYFDMFILDRGPWDAGCWLEYVKQEKGAAFGGANVEEVDAITRFFQLPYWSTQAHIHVLLTVEPDEAKTREAQQRLIEHQGPASNVKLMTSIHQIYQDRFEQLKKLKNAACPKTAGVSTLGIHTSGGASPRDVALQVP